MANYKKAKAAKKAKQDAAKQPQTNRQPAHPVMWTYPGFEGPVQYPGLTIRDVFAAQIIGKLAPHWNGTDWEAKLRNDVMMAFYAADIAMLTRDRNVFRKDAPPAEQPPDPEPEPALPEDSPPVVHRPDPDPGGALTEHLESLDDPA